MLKKMEDRFAADLARFRRFNNRFLLGYGFFFKFVEQGIRIQAIFEYLVHQYRRFNYFIVQSISISITYGFYFLI